MAAAAALVGLVAVPALEVSAATGDITTYAGGDIAPGLSPATSTGMGVWGVAVNATTLYVADSNNNVIRAVNRTTGEQRVVAGTGHYGSGGDGGPATSARLAAPKAVAVDASGNLFVADSDNHRVRRVAAADGVISTFAGSGTNGFGGDGGMATAPAAKLSNPMGLAIDGGGNLFIADAHNFRVRRVQPSGIITTVAGSANSGFAGDGGPATAARLTNPLGVAVDSSDNLYIADTYNHRVRMVVVATGTILTVAGNGNADFSGDGGLAIDAALSYPRGVAVDGDGNLFIADTNNQRIRRVTAGVGVIATVAGDGAYRFGGDGGPATAASLAFPVDVALDPTRNLFIADTDNHRVRRVSGGSSTTTGTITTMAGTGSPGFGGDGGPRAAARLWPGDVVTAPNGNLYIADLYNNRIRMVEASTGAITTVAGTGLSGFEGDGQAATLARLSEPWGLALGCAGNLYIADTYNHRVRMVSPGADKVVNGSADEVITTVAGNGTWGFSGDTGQATAARIDSPDDVTVDCAGNVFIADSANFRVRKVTPGGDGVVNRGPGEVITTVAGTGDNAFAGDGEPAATAKFSYINGVAVDGGGRLYVADSDNNRIRRIAPGGDGVVNGGVGEVVTTVAGNGDYDYSGDGGLATAASLAWPEDLTIDGSGAMFIADSDNHRVRRVDPVSQEITTVAGDGYGFDGDGGPATSAKLRYVGGVAVDHQGNLLIADLDNARVRRAEAVAIPRGAAPGQLRVTTDPPLPSQILVDGVPRDSWGLTWLSLPAGTYTVGFTHVEGFTEPAPQTVTVSAGAVTEVTGTFTRRGSLRVLTEPAVPATISVDGVPRNEWGMWTDLPTGNHTVCFGAVAGFAPPPCQNATVASGALTTVTGAYTADASRPGAAGTGDLRVITDPPLPSQILVDGVPRDSWGLTWADLSPGTYTVSFTHVEGYTEPPPQTVSVAEGQVTQLVGTFVRRGSLRVTTEPAVPATISVDGLPRNNWGMWTDLPAGAHTVCFGAVSGFVTPACQSITFLPGELRTVTGGYAPA